MVKFLLVPAETYETVGWLDRLRAKQVVRQLLVGALKSHSDGVILAHRNIVLCNVSNGLTRLVQVAFIHR